MANFSSGLSGNDFTPSVDYLTAQHRALGHVAAEFDRPEMATILRRRLRGR